ncbi:hypothetical protein F2Q70_00029519 [Brassica cretica]|uniref:Uncharacterized protein n=1 Tax=Brassica cretica TaxID=69181 RepID=A0A8S9FF78_BRACR|nr:hypothetical protein F2Q70_00029519 [Brassica cretica]
MINPNVIRENECLQFLNRKVPTVTPIETKQEQVRSNHRRGSYENGVKAAWSVQLAHLTSWSRWHWKAYSNLYILTKDGLNQTMGRSSSIAKHLTRLCSSAPQKTSVLGLEQDLGLITALRGAMTTSSYVSRIIFDLIPPRFKVRDMFSAYMTCMILPFLTLREGYVFEKVLVRMIVWSSKKVVLSRKMFRGVVEFGLNPTSEKHFCQTMLLDKSQNVVWPLSVGAMVSQIVWLGVKDVFTQIAKDVIEGQRALVKIDRPSLSGLSVLRWLIVIENDSPL